MKKLDKYSVIMSVYYKVNPEHLKESIYSILKQTYAPDEFILIKDGKLTLEQEQILNKIIETHKNLFKVIEFEENKGAGAAYNVGLNNCTNEYAAIMDSDDFAREDKFELQMTYLKEHKDIDIIGSNAVEFMDSTDNIISTRIMPEFDEEIKSFAHGRCPIIQPTAIFRVQKVLESGGYQESKLTEDYNLYIRMIMNGCKFYTYQEILYYVRVGEDFFKRRGGLKYLKPILGFKYEFYKKGFFKTKEFIKTFASSLIVALMPNFMRTFVYKKFLRN